MTPVTGWTLRYRLTGSDDDPTISPNSPNSAANTGEILMGLQKGTSYDVMVAASNSAGMGEFKTVMGRTQVDRELCASHLKPDVAMNWRVVDPHLL